MGKNLFDFGDEKIEEKKDEEVKNVYEKYKDFSKNDLMNEFLSKSREQLKNGKLSFQQLDKIANDISPMLNDNQKEFLSNLFGKLKDE